MDDDDDPNGSAVHIARHGVTPTEAEEDEFWRTHALGDELFEQAEPLAADEAGALARANRARRKARPA